MRSSRVRSLVPLLSALVFLVTPAARAQITPQCASGCIGVSVTPDGGTVTRSPNTGPFTAFFTVENTGTLSSTYTFTCSRTGGITCGTVTPSSATIAGLMERGVQVTYSVGTIPGTVRLTASGPDIDQGYYNVNLIGPPVVALRNHSDSIMDRSLCLTAGAGDAAAFSCGDLVVTHAMPGYRTMGRERSLTLIYNSGTARPQPVVVAAITEGGTTVIPTNVLVELSVADAVVKTVTYPGSSWGTGPVTTRQVAISYDASGTATGAYPFTLRVQNQYPTATKEVSRSGTLLIVNRSASELGKGVWLAGVEQLVPNQPSGQSSLLWVGGDGSARLYRPTTPSSPTIWVAPSGAYQDSIKLVGGQYTRFLRHNVKVTFDGAGHHVTTTNKAGHVTTFTWVSSRLMSIKVPPGVAGTTYTLTYGADTRLDYILDPASRKLDATTTASGLLQSLKDPDLRLTTFGYDPSTPLMTSRTNRQGNTTKYAYANGRRLTSDTIPIGRTTGDTARSVTQFAPWDEKGLTTPVDTAKGYTAVYGPRYRATPPGVSDTAAFWVDRFGAPTRIVNPLGYQTVLQRSDSRLPALVTKVTYPNQRIVLMTYDERGNLLQVRDSTWHLGTAVRLPTKATTYAYGTGSFRDMPTSIVDSTENPAAPLVTSYVYDNTTGLTKQVTPPNQHVTKFAYSTQANSLNLVKAVTELAVPIWNQTTRTAVADSLHTGFAFNGLGNVVADTSPSGRVTSRTLDSYQRVTDTYDPAGHRVQYTYDALNRVTDVTEHVSPTPLTSHTTFNIDLVSAITDPRGVTRQWTYDMAGHAISETDELNHTELRFYNRAGLLDSVRQRVFAGSNGPTIRYAYDAAGERVKMAWPGRPYTNPTFTLPADSVSYVYDNMGRLTSTASVDPLLWTPKKIVRTYYARGELKSETQSRVDGTGAFTHTYSYDRTGRRTSYTMGTVGNTANSDEITYTYKSNGDLNSIRVRWRGMATISDSAVFKWDALGRRDSIGYSNRAFIRFAYDADGGLRLVCGNDAVSAPNYDDVLKFTYNNSAMDADGLVQTTARTLANPNGFGCGSNNSFNYTQNNAFDTRHQLLTMVRSSGESHTYTYDNSGNMSRDDQALSVATDYDFVMPNGTNQLERRVPSVGSVTRYLYDANGARTFECPGVSGCDSSALTYRKYYYDGLARLVGTDEIVPSSVVQVYFPEYDPIGRLTHATDAPAVLGYDGDNVVRTGYDDSNASWTFVHGPGTDDPLMGHYAVLSAGQLWAELKVFYATDGQGQQLAAGDSTGHEVADHTWFRDRGGKYAGGTLNADTYAADRSTSDAMKQLSFFRNRFYDQQTGRWTQEDPIGVAGGLNLYQFNGNNPVAYTDPFGLCPTGDTACELYKAGMQALGFLTGAVDGAARGGAIGTLIEPGGGTLVGGVAGALVEGVAGAQIAGAAADATWISSEPAQMARAGKGRGGNQKPNADVRRIAKEHNLNPAGRRELHDRITGQDMSADDIAAEAADIAQHEKWVNPPPEP